MRECAAAVFRAGGPTQRVQGLATAAARVRTASAVASIASFRRTPGGAGSRAARSASWHCAQPARGRLDFLVHEARAVGVAGAVGGAALQTVADALARAVRQQQVLGARSFGKAGSEFGGARLILANDATAGRGTSLELAGKETASAHPPFQTERASPCSVSGPAGNGRSPPAADSRAQGGAGPSGPPYIVWL